VTYSYNPGARTGPTFGEISRHSSSVTIFQISGAVVESFVALLQLNYLWKLRTETERIAETVIIIIIIIISVAVIVC